MPMTKPTSEQVTFLAAGAGATQRTALDKLRDTFNVMDYVQGDWVPNDSTKDFTPTFAAAIAAVAAAGGGVLEFVGKDNYYFLTRPPELTGGVCLEGNRCIVYKKYVETGTGTYAGAEGINRGVFSFDGNTNNNTFLRNFSIINDAWDGVDTTGNGSVVSIVADAGDSSGPGLIWISNIHCTASTTGQASPADYVWWKSCIYIDGSERRAAPIGVRGVFIENCTLFTPAIAAIEAYAAVHLFVTSTESNVGRTSCCGVKLDGGTKVAGVGAQSDRPMFTGCDFQSVFGYKIGTESTATHSYVQSPLITGTIGQLELGSQALSPALFGSQTNTLTTSSSAYTMVTEDGSNLNGAVRVTGTFTSNDRILANNAPITGVKYPTGSTAWGIAHVGSVDSGAYTNPTLAAGESIRITCASSKLFAVALGGGGACLFFADYKAATVTLISNPSGDFTNAVGTANKVSITKTTNSHEIRIYNEWAATSQIVSICAIGQHPSPPTMGV